MLEESYFLKLKKLFIRATLDQVDQSNFKTKKDKPLTCIFYSFASYPCKITLVLQIICANPVSIIVAIDPEIFVALFTVTKKLIF